MGASPETNILCEKLFSDVDFEMIRNSIGRVRQMIIELKQGKGILNKI